MSDTFEPVRLRDLADAVPDGALLGVPPDYSGVATAATAALVRRGARDLRLFCLPYSTIQADLLVGAGCVREIEAAAVTLGEQGLAPNFSAAVEAGRLVMRDSTCPALHAGLQASEKGVPFLPLRGLLGTDILAHRPDWKVVANPFDPDDEIVALPAVAPDVALFHAAKADSEGNVWIGRRRELATLAHASRRVLVTVEEIMPGSFFEREDTAANALPALYVDAVAVAPNGAWPCGCPGLYGADARALGDYAQRGGDRAAIDALLDRLAPEAALEPMPS
jgi:glutaconate CoA-transferase subunit A